MAWVIVTSNRDAPPRPNALVVSLLVAAVATAARAEPITRSPTPCVNREATAWRQVRDVELAASSLQYCTGDDCWSFDLASRGVTAIPRHLASMPPPPFDPPGMFTDGHGTTLATADETHVEFCPGGSAKPCKS